MGQIDYQGVTNQLLLQAIEAEEKRIADIKTFLENHPLDTDINKTIALELETVIRQAEITIFHLAGTEEAKKKGADK